MSSIPFSEYVRLLCAVFPFYPLPRPQMRLTPAILDFLEDLNGTDRLAIEGKVVDFQPPLDSNDLIEAALRAHALFDASHPSRGSETWNECVENPTEEAWAAKEQRRLADYNEAKEAAKQRCIALAPEFATCSVDQIVICVESEPDPERWALLSKHVDRATMRAVHAKAKEFLDETGALR